jgi:hypothetical protein
MRNVLRGATLTIVACLATAPAQAAEEAKEIIARAVKAHGGAEALRRAAALSRSGKGQLQVPLRVGFTSEETLDLPSRLRNITEIGRNRIVRVLNGDRGWQMANGPAGEMPAGRLAEFQEEAYVLWAATLVPLLGDGFTLTAQPEARVNGRLALGVTAASRGKPDLTLYFDKESGLLVKISRKASEAGMAAAKDYLYADHKDVGGARLPGRETVFLNGNKVYEITYSDYKLLGKPDEKVFERP